MTTGSPDSPEEKGAIRIDLVANKYSSLVYLKNGRSMLWSISLRSSIPLYACTLRITYTPEYAKPQQLCLRPMEAGESVFLAGITPEYDAEALAGLKDDEEGGVLVELLDRDDQVLAAKEDKFTWLAFNAWAGGHEFPETLAALTLPFDPVVDEIMADLLRAVGIDKPEEEVIWPGYDAEPQATLHLLRELWNTIQHHRIKYNLPLEDGVFDICVGQRIRIPSIIKEEGQSTCLDSALLMAACIARLRLNPLVFLISGHAFAGIMLGNKSLPSPVDTPLATVRNLLEQGELLPLEATCLNDGDEDIPIDKAASIASHTLFSHEDDDPYFSVLDIEQIWHTEGIKPIMFGCMPPNTSGLDTQEDSIEEMQGSRPVSRLDNWQRKLLDISSRNSLLNTNRDKGFNIRLYIPDVAKLEDWLADGATLKVRAIPATLWGDIRKFQNQENEPEHLLREASIGMFAKREMLSNKPQNELQRALQNIHSRAQQEMEESGANTLFIACGFLRWVPTVNANTARHSHSYLAPILLIPVQMGRRSVRSDFTLKGLDEHALVNNTLLEMIKAEFGIRIPELEHDLPTDDSGLDVPLIFDIIRKAISKLPGWEVVEECSIGLYTFAKYLMWKDLVDRRDILLQNPIVKQLASTERGTFPEQTGFPDPYSLDNEVDASQVYTPLPCDSSQLAAILAAARGKNFVLVGPPGTGKSQTIANMIAHCLGHGKTVLFLAEKAVALNVVHERLKKIGLGEFCLNLHSKKVMMKSVMEEFRAAVGTLTGGTGTDSWDQETFSMATVRYRLNMLPWEMHRPYPDGTSLYSDICTVSTHTGVPDFPPMEGSMLTCTAERKQETLAYAHELATLFSLAKGQDGAAMQAIRTQKHSMDWEDKLAGQLRSYGENATRQEAAAAELAGCLGCGKEELAKELPYLPDAMQIQEYGKDNYRACTPEHAEDTLRILRKVASLAAEYRELRQKLSLPYPESVLDDPELDSWLKGCKEAMMKALPMRWLAMKKVVHNLQVQAMSKQQPDCLPDLQNLVQMRQLRKQARESAGHVLPEMFDKGMETDTDLLQKAEKTAARMAELYANAPVTAKALLESGQCPANARTQIQALGDLLQAAAAMRQELADTLGSGKDGLPAAAKLDAKAWADSLLAAKNRWQETTLWNKKAAGAKEAGHGMLTDLLITGSVQPQDLETAILVNFSRRRLREAANTVETLQEFSPLLHEERIRDFIAWDNHIRKATQDHIRHLLRQRASGISRHGQETAILQREMSKQRAYMPLRQLLASTPHITPMLKPCFLMSPLSAAQYLTAETEPFDVVIFDEASQIPVWDAVGAIARGKSAIITGDPNQMPPSSFFGRSKTDEGADGFVEQDMESILDECLACGIPRMNLTWHYRSKSEALISFSNTNYYQQRMITFPAPAVKDTALQYHFCGGIYEPGASKRINPTEARAVVDHIVSTLKAPGFRYTEATSIGVVTFNATQQNLIMQLLEEERAKDPSLEPYFDEDCGAPIFVKNLENVQGDERGVIYFSTTYGKDARGHMISMFGPLSLPGGEKRLNVAVTRARTAMHIFTSMEPGDIKASPDTARGAADLKAFLQFARSGTLEEKSGGMLRKDALARAIASRLEENGWPCRTDMGNSKYKVDIVVANPDEPQSILCGITLDGPEYAASHTARDRDLVRNETMRLLGWRMLNVWSMDWWRRQEDCMNRILEKLQGFQAEGPLPPAELPSLTEAGQQPTAPEPERAPEQPQQELPRANAYDEYKRPVDLPPTYEMSDASIMQEIANLVEVEYPVCDSYLFRHLGLRRKSKDLPRVVNLLQAMIDSKQLGVFFDNEQDPAMKTAFLLPEDSSPVRIREKGPREWTEMPIQEITEAANLVQAHLKCLPCSDDHIKGICTFFGVGRLTQKAKDTLLSIIRR